MEHRRRIALALAAILAGAAAGQTAVKSNIVPDSYLRGYDPVSVFYDRAVGPASGGPADGPGEYLSVVPPVPGEYRWLDARTVQFLPAVPWPALREFTVKARDRSVTLTTMMVPPSAVTPSPGSTGLEPISSFTLSFPAVLDTAVLSRMIRLEVRELPGLTTEGSWTLSSADFTVRELERSKTAASAAYLVTLKSPVPYGKHVILSLRLSLDDTISDSVAKYAFQTKPEFRLSGMGSGSVRFPVTPSGAVYAMDQAVNCGTERAPLFLEFSEDIIPIGVETLKRMAVFEPAVRNLAAEVSGTRLYLRFDADRDKPYKLTLAYQDIRSISGRKLSPFSKASFYFYYKQANPYLQWQAAQGIVERYGPQFLPMEGRGTGRVDLRVHKIDPQSLNFWPFPDNPVAIDENSRPPMPGEEPEYGRDVARQIRLLGSPEISKVMDLPIGEGSGRSAFGIDLGAELAAKFGKQAPGTYLVGYRLLGSSSTRSYVRLTVTDLSLTTVEEENSIVFVVASLKTGAPVEGAVVRVESRTDKGVSSMIEGRTDKSGQYRYVHARAFKESPARIVVEKDGDVLVMNPRSPPPVFADNHWSEGSSSWLGWITSSPTTRRHERRTYAYILTERPIYRPEEPVYLIGWIRDRKDGQILPYGGKDKFEISVSGPGGKEWVYPGDLSGNGRFTAEFKQNDLPTGQYAAAIRYKSSRSVLASVPFSMESYRVPLFEAVISGPDKAPLDKPFELVLTADYYSGGRVVGEEVRWRVTRYPYSISSPLYPGFLFSTDERFSGDGVSGVSGALAKSDVLDDEGSSRIQINPAAERDGRARRYVAEATVVGADRQTVSTVKQVYALPPFSIGLRMERFLTDSTVIKPEIVVLDHEEKPLAGKEVTVRLSQRQWHSYIAETDFTTGEAKYVTDVVDKPMEEKGLVSKAEPVSPSFTVKEAGVYIVEVFARDYLGRQIMVKSDLFVAGGTPVAWEKSRASVFEVSPDRKSYQPGMTAKLLLKSPYQDGWALVVTEGPESNRYDWVKIANGQGIFQAEITEDMVPSLSIGVLLERGRVPGTEAAASRVDLGKPSSLGASVRLRVEPVANQIKLVLNHEEKKLPGSTLKIKIGMTDWKGRSLDGEVALWMVDKAVLALGTERPLDPLSPFIDTQASSIRIRDTRNLVFGNLPVEEMPGGDGMEMEEMAKSAAAMKELFERTTVRKNFKTVAYFNPSIPVKGGTAEIEIQLPDNLTDFAIRAVATSGHDKFGSARSVVSIRLPVIVQSALPRFVRPMDSFSAGGLARIVEGSGGPGLAGITVEGLVLEGKDPAQAGRDFVFDPKKAEKLLFPLRVPADLLERQTVKVAVSLFAQRNADKARDAFRIELPVRNDVDTRRISALKTVTDSKPFAMPEPKEAMRKGTVTRTVIAARDPRLISVIQGLNYLSGYAHGCLEQRMSKLYPAVMLKDLLESSGIPKYYPVNDAAMRDFFAYMASCQDDEGLFGYWPGSTGYVSLTAYAVEFLVSCRDAKISFDPKLLERSAAALRRALRSDYNRLLSGWSTYERVEALTALEAAGTWDEGYATDLLAQSEQLGLYSQARLYIALKHRGLSTARKAQDLEKRLIGSVVTKREAGREVYAGLQADQRRWWGGLVLGSPIRTVGAMATALYMADPKSVKAGMLADYIVSQSGEEGWGNTADNVAAMRALKSLLTVKSAWMDAGLDVSSSAGRKQYSMGGKGIAVFQFEDYGQVTVSVSKGADQYQGLSLLMYTDYQPMARGTLVKAENEGFAVDRELIEIGEDGAVLNKTKAAAGKPVTLALDTVVEEHVTVVNFEDRNFVAVTAPIAAGFEPLNPQLAGAPREATPAGSITLRPTYSLYADDKVVFYYNTLPKGTYHFYFRVRASFSGSFTEPAAGAELMYDLSTRGRSDGAEIKVPAENAQ